jgi:hypothetical protein
MFPTFVTILPLTIPANYPLSSQCLSVGLKVGVHVWFKVSVRFGEFINNTQNARFAFNYIIGLKVRVAYVKYDIVFTICLLLDIQKSIVSNFVKLRISNNNLLMDWTRTY